MAKPKFFKTQDDFREWLERHHESQAELIVGYWKVDSGKPSMTWSESVDQGLCFGWIDGIRRRINDTSYSIRFTPRKPGSKWSDVNLKKVAVLKRKKLIAPAGLLAFGKRVVGRRAGYAYEEDTKPLPKEMEKELKAHKKAWTFLEGQAPSNKKKILHWLTSGKQDATNWRRLDKLISDCEQGNV